MASSASTYAGSQALRAPLNGCVTWSKGRLLAYIPDAFSYTCCRAPSAIKGA